MPETWEEAQEWERRWWGDCQNTQGEEDKQLEYLKFMEISTNLKGKNVCDIGGGPVSILLKCCSLGKRCTVVDPGMYPGHTVERYNKAGIRVAQVQAEDFRSRLSFDEVWIYNVLQHVEDPKLLADTCKLLGVRVRVFEWIDIPIYRGHLHSPSAKDLQSWFGCEGRIVRPSFCTLGEEAWVSNGL